MGGAPAHCTGEVAFAILQATFGDHYVYAGLGTTLGLEGAPLAETEARDLHARDEIDRRGYRAMAMRAGMWRFR